MTHFLPSGHDTGVPWQQVLSYPMVLPSHNVPEPSLFSLELEQHWEPRLNAYGCAAGHSPGTKGSRIN